MADNFHGEIPSSLGGVIQVHNPRGFDTASNAQSGWKNERGVWDWFDTITLPQAIDFVNNTLAPPTEVDGDVYVIDATGASHASWDGAAANSWVRYNAVDDLWNAITPAEGMTFWDQANDLGYTYDGTAWALPAGGGGGSLSATLAIGNTTGSNNISVNTGQSIIYNNSSFTATINEPTLAGNIVLTLPTSTGTIALTSDITAHDGNGLFSAANDGATVPTAFDVALTDTLNFDSDTFVIDGTNNRIGVGTASPSQVAHFKGAAGAINIEDSAAAFQPAIYFNGSKVAHFNVPAQTAIVGASTFFGFSSATGVLGSSTSNTGFGFKALESVTSGGFNVGVGTQVLGGIGAGSRNMAVGHQAGFQHTGFDNVAMGYFAGRGIIGAQENCIHLGSQAGNHASGGGGTRNVGVGHQAQANWTAAANHNIAIGYQAGYFEPTTGGFVGTLSIGHGSKVTASRQVCIGGNGTNDFSFEDFVIGTSLNPAAGGKRAIQLRPGRTNTGTANQPHSFTISGGEGSGNYSDPLTSGFIAFQTSDNGAAPSVYNSLVERMRIQSDSGYIGMGQNNPISLLDVDGDGEVITIPRKSTTGDPSGANGQIYYNTVDLKFRKYENGAWSDFGGGGGGDVATDTIWDAAGDLALGTGSDAAAKLGIGTAGQLLTVSGSTAAWTTYTGSTSVTTLGTISTGVWSGTAISVSRGGTGLSSYTTGDLIYASAPTTLSKLAASTNGFVLTSNGAGVAPTWQAAVGGGDVGTDVIWNDLGDLVQGNGVDQAVILPAVASGNALISQGGSQLNAWGKIGLTTHVSGTLGIGNGGTGITTAAKGSVIVANANDAFSILQGTIGGQVLTYNAGTDAMEFAAPPDSNGIYDGSGTLLGGNTTVTQGSAKMIWTGSVVDSFNIDGGTFSVDASNNRVGIGTASPSFKLHVEDTVASALNIYGKNLSAAGWMQTRVDCPTGVNTMAAVGASSGTHIVNTGHMFTNMPAGAVVWSDAIGSDIRFGIGTGAGQTAAGTIKMTLNATQLSTSGVNVGLGIATPTERLHVSGNTLITGDLAVDTSTLKVDSTNNNVGIGTASPSTSYKLDVSGGGIQAPHFHTPFNPTETVPIIQLDGSTSASIGYDQNLSVGGAGVATMMRVAGSMRSGSTDFIGLNMDAASPSNGPVNTRGITVSAANGSTLTQGVRSVVGGQGNDNVASSSYATAFEASVTSKHTLTNYGFKSLVRPTITGTTNVGVQSHVQSASGLTQTSTAGFFDAEGHSSAGAMIGLHVRARTGATNYGIVVEDGSVGVGTVAPDASAALDIVSTTQGVLMPRMTGVQVLAITGVDGLVVYATATSGAITSVGFWGYEAGAWVKL